ncbi:MAG: T9SS type A sorting domain-containing protein [Sphingobacteriaceae bacterium]|nr:T9SS type A sorting domain-containing protein [Sphingobacteriaceae bacterium]
MKHTHWALFILAFFCLEQGMAQEVITPLASNPLQAQYNANFRIANRLDTINLPFVDDFSGSQVTPSATRWTDRFVYVNTDMAEAPPTLGVATFDGLNQFGVAYDIFSPTASGVADRLTSQAINLGADDAADSIYLSFFWQPAGLCDPPEATDSLTLEFFGRDGDWYSVWRVTGTSNRPFRQQLVRVGDSLFFHQGFRFRFTSYGNLTGNVDVWHLDYVRLARNRTSVDTAITDVGFKLRPSSLLNVYQEMPFKQFKADSARYKALNHTVLARNLGADRNVAYKFTTRNFLNGDVVVDAAFQNISPFSGSSDVTFSFPSFPINISNSDSLTLQTTYLLQNSPDFLARNDTVRRFQRFWNHYAFDDGTAETGYGLNIIGGSIAYKFYVTTPDTLRGMWMYFTQAAENASLELFNLKVWSFIGENQFTGSESLLRQQELLRPRYADSIGQFMYYALDTPVVVRDSFYVGWQQLTPRLLNIGLDRNNNPQGVKWFNTQGQWNPSLITGAWMIRPVLGGPLVYPTALPTITNLRMQLYPNPASDFIILRCECAVKQWNIKDMTGRVVASGSQIDSPILVGDLPIGMYVVELHDQRQLVSRQKLILSR